MKTLLRTCIIFIALFLLWEASVFFFDLPHYILPEPSSVLLILIKDYPIFLTHLLPTLYETVLGFIFGILFGLSAALLVSFYRTLALWLLPLILMSQATPTFAIAPLLVIWLGFGLTSKIVCASLMIFFPVTSTFYDGLRQTRDDWLALGKTMQASKWRLFYHVQIPAALPQLAGGIRIAAVTAPIGAVVGEWVGSSRGLGYLMLNANARLQIDMMFAALIIIIAMALLLYFLVDKLLRKAIWW